MNSNRLRQSMMKLLKNSIRSLPLAAMVVTFDFATWRHVCDYGGDVGPYFYGFPMIYRTEIPWVNSLSGEFYLLGFLVDLLLFAVFSGLLLTVVQKELKMPKKTSLALWITSWLFAASITILNHTSIEWQYYWRTTSDHYLNHYKKECEKRFLFFGWND
jgi:hypothetical protein